MEITDAGFKSIEVGAMLFSALKLPTYEISEPGTFEKIKEVAEFLNDHEDPSFIISQLSRRVMDGKQKLDFLTGLAKLEKEKEFMKRKLSNIDKELKHYYG